MGQLDRLVRTDRLSPKRAAHAVNERLAIGHKAGAGWPSSQLRQIKLAPVITVRQVHLLQDWLACGFRRSAQDEERKCRCQHASNHHQVRSLSVNCSIRFSLIVLLTIRST